MGWHQIPEFNSVSSADDNPFAGSRVSRKVSVKLPVDDWLCKKWRSYIPSPQSSGQRSNLTTKVKTTISYGSRVF